MLTAEQIEQYARCGFVNGGPVLDEAAVDMLQREVLRVIDDREKPDGPQPFLLRNLAAVAGGDDAHPIWQIINIWQASPAFKELVTNRRILEMTAQLTGARELRLWHDQIQYKPKEHGGRLQWHQDSPLWSSLEPKDAQITAWVALDDAEADNGCMFMVPGSHRWGNCQAQINQFPNDGSLPDQYEGERVYLVMCPVKKGHVHFHHSLTWHGSGTNHSSRPRRAIGIHFMTERTTFRGAGDHILHPHITVADGAKLAGDLFPQVWGE